MDFAGKNVMCRALDQLRGYVEDGPVQDITMGRECYEMITMIDSKGSFIFEKGQHLGNLFASLDRVLVRQLILSISRLYDRPSNRHDIRSIPTILSFLRNNASVFCASHRNRCTHHLRQAGFSVPPGLSTAADEEFTKELVDLFANQLPDAKKETEELSQALAELKTLRNRAVAHNENVAGNLPSVRWVETSRLLEFAETFVCVLGWAYLQPGYCVDDARFLLAEDTKLAAHQLKLLLVRAGVIRDDRIERWVQHHFGRRRWEKPG